MFKANLSTIASMYIDCSDSEIQELRDYYNKHCVQLVKSSRKYHIKDDDNWCAMFVSVVAHKAGFRRDHFPYEVSVLEQVKLAKERGTLSDSIKYVDDLIIYNWNGDSVPDHVGIIKSIKGDLIEVIEGNYKGGVGIRTVRLPSNFVTGFIIV